MLFNGSTPFHLITSFGMSISVEILFLFKMWLIGIHPLPWLVDVGDDIVPESIRVCVLHCYSSLFLLLSLQHLIKAKESPEVLGSSPSSSLGFRWLSHFPPPDYFILLFAYTSDINSLYGINLSPLICNKRTIEPSFCPFG